MKIVKSIMTKNPCYSKGYSMNPRGLMLHSVGTPQPSAEVFIKNWNSPYFESACVHGFIDGNSGTVYQTLPWNWHGWHAGGAANDTHIGVEMCEPSSIRYTTGASFAFRGEDEAERNASKAAAKAVAKRTYESAVELFAYLCKEFGFDPLKDGVILSHAEGNKRGIATAHADPEHLWRGLGLSYTMDGFRKDVKAAMNPKRPKYKPKDIARENTYQALYDMNIRKSHGTNQQKVGTLKKGAKVKFIYLHRNSTGLWWGKIADNQWVCIKDSFTGKAYFKKGAIVKSWKPLKKPVRKALEKVPVYDKPSTETGKVVANIRKGKAIEFDYAKRNFYGNIWGRIANGDQKGRWVMMKSGKSGWKVSQ